MLNQLCTWTAKTRAIPSLHRDNFPAKVPGLRPVLRQVTQTPFIAGPLVVIYTDCNRFNPVLKASKQIDLPKKN